MLIAAGVPLAMVSKIIGHSSVSITADLYGHLGDGAGRRAAEMVSALFTRAGGASS